jgi:hypothetical protein
MGIAGYVAGYDRTDKQQRTSRQTHTQGNNKNNEVKQHRKNTNGNVQSVTTWKKGRKNKRS